MRLHVCKRGYVVLAAYFFKGVAEYGHFVFAFSEENF